MSNEIEEIDEFHVTCRLSYTKFQRSKILNFEEWEHDCLVEIEKRFEDFQGFGEWSATKSWYGEKGDAGKDNGYFQYMIELKREDCSAFHEQGLSGLMRLGKGEISGRILDVDDKEDLRRLLNIYFPDIEGWDYRWGGIDWGFVR